MIFGIFLLIITGLCLSVIGAVISNAAHKQLDCNLIQGLAALICVLVCIAVIPFLPSQDNSFEMLSKIYLIVFSAGVCNYLMLKLMNHAMVGGHNGAVWGITQSALIFPFAMGVISFDVKLTWFRLTGLFFILLAILFFSMAKSRKTSSGFAWLKYTLGAFIFAGISQCFSNLPSYMHSVEIGNVRRTFFVQMGVLVAFVFNFCLDKKYLNKRNGQIKSCFAPAVLLAGTNIISLFFFFYSGLNILAKLQAGSLGYPITMGSCIAIFFLYSCLILKEKTNRYSITAFISVIIGIVIISV